MQMCRLKEIFSLPYSSICLNVSYYSIWLPSKSLWCIKTSLDSHLVLCGCQIMKLHSCHYCDCYSMTSNFNYPYSLKSWYKYFANKCMEGVVPSQKIYNARSQFSKMCFAVCSHTCLWWGGVYLGEDYHHILKPMPNFSALMNWSLRQDKKREQERESEKLCGKLKSCLCFVSC